MQLNKRTLRILAEMICGGAGNSSGYSHTNFKYRSSSALTQFFDNCDLDHVHDGSTRAAWVQGVLEELNAGLATNPQLPTDSLIRVVRELLDAENFHEATNDDQVAALADVNRILKRDGLEAYMDEREEAQLRRVDFGADSSTLQPKQRKWTPEEERLVAALAKYLNTASEDEFTEKILVPLFSCLGFQRLFVAGHEDKAMEFGIDLWMRFQLPTRHFIYFGVQVKKGKIDAAGKTKGERQNVSEVLNQVQMMLDYPIFDPDVNRQVLVDHAYIIASGNITKQARTYLVHHLDTNKRRHIIFLDREELLDLVIKSRIPLPEMVRPEPVGYQPLSDLGDDKSPF